MNNKSKIVLLLVAFCAVLALPARNNAKEAILFDKFVEPIIHGSQFLDLNGHASIDIAVLVNEEGVVDDWITIRTNDKKLVKSIGYVIDEWRFKPSIVNDKPSWAYHELKVAFQKTGSVITITPNEATLTLFNLLKDDIAMVVPFNELDEIPKPLVVEKPTIHTSMRGNNAGKSVRMEFFIDENGAVRMPVVVESGVEDQVAAVLMQSLFKWKFEPPTRNGRKVATRAVVPFNIQ